MIAKAMQKVGNEGVITVEEAKTAENRTRHRRRHAVRPRLSLALFHHQRRQDVASLRTSTSSCTRRSCRLSVDAGRSSKLWCRPRVRSSSSPRTLKAKHSHPRGERLRGGLKVAAVKAPGFGDRRKACWKTSPSSRAPGDLGRSRHQARERHDRHAWPRQAREVEKENTTIAMLRQKADINGRCAQIKQQSKRRPPTTTGKLQERLPSLRAALPSSRSAARRSRSEGKEGRVDDALNATALRWKRA